MQSEIEQRQSMAKHFKTLSHNHDELIKIKDDYKQANDELRRRNAQLLDENNNMIFPLVQQKEEELAKLNSTLEVLKSENAHLQKSIRSPIYKYTTIHLHVLKLPEFQNSLFRLVTHTRTYTHKLRTLHAHIHAL